MVADKLKFLFSQDDYLSKKNTDSLKGIFAVLIVLTHARGMTTCFNDTIIGMILTASGYLSVAMFFFLSGYGLNISYKKKESYIKNFPRNKILDFYVKYIVLILFHSLLRFFITGQIWPKRMLMASVFLDNVIVYGWYLQAIFFLYSAFWVVMRFVPLKRIEIKAGLITAIYLLIIVVIIKNNRMLYCESVLGFTLGLLWCEYKDKIDKFIFGKKYYILLILSFCLFSVFLLIGNLNVLNIYLKNIAKVISAPLFVAFVLLLVKPFNIKNALTEKIGAISFEIYVFQSVFLNLFSSKFMYIESFVLYFIASLVCSVLFSLIMHKFFKKLSKLIKYKY